MSLVDFAMSDRQKEVIQAYEDCGSKAQVAKKLGLNIRTVQRSIASVTKRAASKGYSDQGRLNHKTAEGFSLKGYSVLAEDADGHPTWYKADRDKEAAIQSILDAFDEKADNLPSIPVIKSPNKTVKDLLTSYNITDFHLGAYAWAEETGDDWDTDIAHQVLLNAIMEMMEGSPDSEMGLLAFMGDLIHWDGLDAVTPTAGNILEADTRFPRLVEMVMDLAVECVGMLLQKHKRVHVIICEGNHDLAGSVWLQKFLKKIFAKNKRVSIDDSAFPYYAYQWGDVMIAYHHGHKKKNKDLPALFASEPRFREMWGQCKKTYIHTGHYHHFESKEDAGAKVERHPTLAGRDAYAARGGWIADRCAHAITYHKVHGEDSRKTVTPREK